MGKHSSSTAHGAARRRPVARYASRSARDWSFLAPIVKGTLVAAVAISGTAFAYVRGAAMSEAQTHGPPQLADAGAVIAVQQRLPNAQLATQLQGFPALPPLGLPSGSRPATSPGAVASSLSADGIPLIAWQAYQQAAQQQAAASPGCHLSWTLLAGIGRVESDHGRFHGTTVYSDGRTAPPIIGIPLNGNGTAVVRDTDRGRLDGDKVYDHAVGPMQFIPSTWAAYGVDATGDGIADPSNIIDAAAAAARYLCASGGDLSTTDGQLRALAAYNPSRQYGLLVLSVAATYAGSTPPLLPTTSLPPARLPAVNPGPPLSSTATDGTADSSQATVTPSDLDPLDSSTAASPGIGGGASSTSPSASSPLSVSIDSGTAQPSDSATASSSATPTITDPVPTSSVLDTSSVASQTESITPVAAASGDIASTP